MYEAFYNLAADPFRLSPDHRFCYKHRSYGKARAYLQYGLQRAEGFVMVTGAPGTGKTTLINDLLATAAPPQSVVARLVSSHMEADDLLRMVAYAFGLSAEDTNKATLLRRLESFLTQKCQAGRRALLVVDEAQDLSPGGLEELRLLTNLQLNDQPLLQIFLLGQEGLGELIRDPSLEQFHQRLIAACHLEPLSARESRSYIEHRLAQVGWRNDPSITDEAFELIYDVTRGVPRRINQLCSRLLLHGSLEERHALTDEDVRTVVHELREELLLPWGELGGTDGEPAEAIDRAARRPSQPEPHPGADAAPEPTAGPAPLPEAEPAPGSPAAEAEASGPASSEDWRLVEPAGSSAAPSRGAPRDGGPAAGAPRHAEDGHGSVHWGAWADGQALDAEPSQPSAPDVPGGAAKATTDPAEAAPPLRADWQGGESATSPELSLYTEPQGGGGEAPSLFPDEQVHWTEEPPAIRGGRDGSDEEEGYRRPGWTLAVALVAIVALAVYATGVALGWWHADPRDWLAGAASVSSAPGASERAGEVPSKGSAADDDAGVAAPPAGPGTSANPASRPEPGPRTQPAGGDGAPATPGDDPPEDAGAREAAGSAQPRRVSNDQPEPAQPGGDAPAGSANGPQPSGRPDPSTAEATPTGESGPSESAPSDEGQSLVASLAAALEGHATLVRRLADGRVEINMPSEASFAFDSSQLKPASRPVLNRLAAVLERHDGTRVSIIGHTDRFGAEDYNRWLSRRRAEAVARYLRDRGIAGSRLETEGRGSSDPMDASEGADPSVNRRVELFVTPAS